MLTKDKAAPVVTAEKVPEEDLNPFLIFPNPEENLKVFNFLTLKINCILILLFSCCEPNPSFLTLKFYFFLNLHLQHVTRIMLISGAY